jgi:hypothetical protein
MAVLAVSADWRRWFRTVAQIPIPTPAAVETRSAAAATIALGRAPSRVVASLEFLLEACTSDEPPGSDEWPVFCEESLLLPDELFELSDEPFDELPEPFDESPEPADELPLSELSAAERPVSRPMFE